jgi:hypothetical protein
MPSTWSGALGNPDGASSASRGDDGPEHDYWTVQGEGRSWLLPAVTAIVERVDLAARRVVVRPPEGLVELDA